tara:strand:- start:206 stop:646 length:441 start_codon:yes stop_codon:yes gene_type:complete
MVIVIDTEPDIDNDSDTDNDTYNIMDNDNVMIIYNFITPHLNHALSGCASYINEYVFNYYVGTYMLWITLHYLSANLYSEFCTDWSVTGFILFPFIAVTPWCKSLAWVIQKGTVVLDEGYLLLGTYFSLQLMKHLPINNNNKNKND